MKTLAAALAAALIAGCAGTANDTPALTAANAVDALNSPPAAPREFRAAWVAAVANIDWPSKRGLSTDQQRAEIIRIVDLARELNLNALIVQVRPSADALYPSVLEPWSEYLTGEQGKAPQPFYDPLQVWIEESHKRGIELHAWFNPYRARHTSAKGANAASHISNTNRAVVKDYGGFQWIDPGEPAAAFHTFSVIMDVVRRYDIDGVHIDDYFYPYPVAGPAVPGAPAGTTPPDLDFPDDPSWSAYLLRGGTLSRADWRRENVNELIRRIHEGIHREKSWLRFGVSPFGVGRPDRRPPGISGFSQYDKLYADVELWLRNGWMDYLVPQLYWRIDQTAQAYAPLLDYWNAENTRGRNVWAGLFTSRIQNPAGAVDDKSPSWKPEEILNQIEISRVKGVSAPLSRGHVHFSMVALLENRQGITDRLKTAYAQPALVPATPWLDTVPVPAPTAVMQSSSPVRASVLVTPGAGKPISQYAVWARYGTAWQFSVANAGSGTTEIALPPANGTGALAAVTISAIDRVGNESPRVAVLRAESGR